MASQKKLTIDARSLQSMREKLRAEIETELDGRQEVVLPEHVLMRTISHFCESEDECQQKIRRTSSYYTFAPDNGILVRDDYIDDENIPRYFDTSQLRNAQEYFLVGSKNHVCSFEASVGTKPDLEEFVSVNRSNSSSSLGSILRSV